MTYPNHQKHRPILGLTLLGALFVVAPLYTHPNIGGLGFNLPFNIAEWGVAILFICFCFYFSIKKDSIAYSPLALYGFIFPGIVILSALLEQPSQPVTWLFRQLYIFAGSFFLFALFQLRLTTRQLEFFLYLLALSTLCHALVGTSQLLDIASFHRWIPPSLSPVGIFQQVNAQASYLATGLLIILYLISRPSFLSTKLLTRLLLVVTFGLGIYVIVSSGSRVGIIAFILGCTLIAIGRRTQLARHKAVLACLVIASVIGIIAGQEGFNRALDKTIQLTDSEYASARKSMYTIGSELIKNKPVFGHGIGSFPRVWAEQTAKFSTLHPNATLPQATTTHPHNELLFWLIEGGLLAVTGLAAIIVAILRSLYLCKFSRGTAYAALLLPISLHTQVELPFYTSSVHWFLWLFLVFITFRHQAKTAKLRMSWSAKKSSQLVVIFIGLASTLFLLHTEKAEKALFNHMYTDNGNLQIAIDNLYFNSFAEKLMMQDLLYSSIKENNKTAIPVFMTWAEKTIINDPEQGMFILLTNAYDFVDEHEKKCLTAQKGLAIYTQNKHLKKALSSCAVR